MKQSQGPAARRNVRLPVEFRFEHSELRLFAESLNMSRSGMLVLSEDPKPPGTIVRFEFEDFRGQARVVWRREDTQGSLLGLRFTDLCDRDRQTLIRILSESPRYI